MSDIKVPVVDDPVVMRRTITDALDADPSIDIVGAAPNGKLALVKWRQLKSDAITMSAEMPQMNGIKATRELCKTGCRDPIIIFSTLTQHDATTTLETLSTGTAGCTTKPANQGSVQQSTQAIRDELVPIITGLLSGRAHAIDLGGSSTMSSETRAKTSSVSTILIRPTKTRGHTGILGRPTRIVVLRSSTGNSEALPKVISTLKPLPVPPVVTQHIPSIFTTQLAVCLDRMTSVVVQEAHEGMMLTPGHIHLATDNYHVTFADNARMLRIKLTRAPPVNFYHPSVDVMFEPAIKTYDGEMLGVVLTGTEQDGKVGCKQILGARGRTLMQDEQSSIAWGMLGAVVIGGSTDRILLLGQISNGIIHHMRTCSPQKK